MPFLTRPGKPTLHYEVDDYSDEWRNPPVMILQHGYGRSARFWYPWVPYLSRYFRIVRPDLRGFGKSPLDFDWRSGYSVEGFLEDMLAIVDAVSPGAPVHYCGESIGGIVGVAFTATYPERVRTLSIVSTPLTIPKHTQEAFSLGYPTWEEAMRTLGSEKWADDTNAGSRFPAEAPEGLKKWYAREMGKSPVDSLCGLARAAVTWNLRPYAERVKTPTLGIYPRGGRITKFDEDLVRNTVPGIRMVTLPTEFHSIQFLMARQCAKEVLYFATQHDGQPCDE